MAKANLSVLLESLQGKSGNVVFKKTKVGTVVTPRVTPKNPNTPAQQSVRAALTTTSRQWQNLTAAQVAAWEAFAAANEPDYDSGINAFVQLGTKVILVAGGGSAPVTPPTAAFTGDTPKLTATVSTGKITFTASAANTAGVVTEILFQPLKSKNRKPMAGAYKTAVYRAFASGSLTYDLNVPAGYYAAGYRFVNASTGQQSRFVSVAVPGPVGLSVATSEGKKKAA